MRLLIIASSLLFAACSSNPPLGNVMPREGGLYDVTSTGETEAVALKSATFTAQSTCKEKRFVVIDSKTTYNGLVSEKTNQVLGMAQGLINMTSGKIIPTLDSETDYKVNLKFKCE